MAFCSWCLRVAVCHDKRLHYACREHRDKLVAHLHETVRDFDILRAANERDRFTRDARDLAAR